MPSEVREYSKNAVICRQGEPADRLFILTEGKVGIYVNHDLEKPTAGQVLVDGLKVGEIDQPGTPIGEGGLFLEIRTASLVALAKKTVLTHIPLTRQQLRQIMVDRPEMSLTICRNLAQRLRDTNDRAGELAAAAEQADREIERLALAFADLLDKIGQLAATCPELTAIVDFFGESPAGIQAQAAQNRRRDTSIIVAQAARGRRTGDQLLRPGERLCAQGEIGRGIYLVKAGELEVRVGGRALGRIGTGEIAGEIAVLLKESPRRCADLLALGDTTVHYIPALDFTQLAESKPQLMVGLAHTLAKRLDLTNRFLGLKTRDRSSALQHLAKHEKSLESAFLQLAELLSPYPAAGALTKLAREKANFARELLAQLSTPPPED